MSDRSDAQRIQREIDMARDAEKDEHAAAQQARLDKLMKHGK